MVDLVEDGGQDLHHLGNAWVVHRVGLVADRARHAPRPGPGRLRGHYQAILWLGAPALRPQLGQV